MTYVCDSMYIYLPPYVGYNDLYQCIPKSLAALVFSVSLTPASVNRPVAIN